MPLQKLRIVMNGVTGRMGHRQHLVRSILALRAEGGLPLPDGSRVPVEPVLVGRDAGRIADLAARYDVPDWTTDLDAALADPDASVYFDAQATHARKRAVLAAFAAGKHVFSEKPTAETSVEAVELAQAAERAGVVHGVVHDKIYLPGLRKLRRLVDAGFFGRVLSIRGEFGYWVFEGDWQTAQRPSWNYRSEDGGGIAVDMFPHWNYVLENVVAPVRAVTARVTTHIPERVDERGVPYPATADDAAYAIFELDGGAIAQVNSSWAVRVHRDELVEFQVDGTHGSAVAGLFGCRAQSRVATPRPLWNPDLPTDLRFRDQWSEVPDNGEFPNGFRAQWEEFLHDVLAGRPHAHDFWSGVRGLRLAEAGLESSAHGRRVEIAHDEPSGTRATAPAPQVPA